MTNISKASESPTEETEANIAWKSDKPTMFIKESLENGLIRQGQVVVDIGCGFGRNSNFLEAKGVRAIGININPEELRIAKTKAQEFNLSTDFIEANATELPLEDSSCDAAIDIGCSHMLNTEDQIRAEAEQARVIKPGGHLLYFGFSKDHPAYSDKPNSPMFRNIDDIKRLYGNDFEIIGSENTEWKPAEEENTNFDIHKGINVVMRRKPNGPT